MKTVLIAEDEEDIRNIMTLYLQQEYHVISYGNGEEALVGGLRTSQTLCFLMFSFPGINGFNICQQLKKKCDDSSYFRKC